MEVIEKIYQLYIECNQIVCIDSREKKIKNSIFFGIRGPNFNGNLYALEALKKGAKYAVIDEKIDNNNEKIIQVHNTIEIIQKIAQIHREKWGYLHHAKSIIGITGTNGKTTTKEILQQILSSKFKTCFTKGNLNNHIGVPLTILSLKKEHDIGIVEIGANHKGEIETLCKIAQPTHGIITNIGKAHLEGFKNIENIIKAKNELYQYIKKTNGTLIVNKLDPLLLNLVQDYQKTIFYNCLELNDQNKQNDNFFYFRCQPFVELYFKEKKIKTKILGKYNSYNIVASIVISKQFNMSLNDIACALGGIELNNNRSQLIQTKQNEIILDAYNANPTSVTLAIENFLDFINIKKSRNHLVILGDMLELGDNSNKFHQEIINLLEKLNFINCILIGENFQKTKNTNNYLKIISLKECVNLLRDKKVTNNTILIKGSRKMQLEKLLEIL